MFGRVLNSPLYSHFRKTAAYLFTKFDSHIPPYIKQYSIGHGQIYSTFASQPYVSKDYASNTEVHLVPSQTSTMDLFSKIKNGYPKKILQQMQSKKTV